MQNQLMLHKPTNIAHHLANHQILEAATMENYIEQVLIPYYQTMLSNPDCFSICDKDGYYIIASNSWAKLAGFRDGLALRGKHDSDLAILSANLVNENQRLNHRVAHTQQPLSEVYLIYRLHLMVKIHKQPLFYPDGSFLGVKTIIQEFKFLHPIAVIPGVVARPFLYSNFIVEEHAIQKFNHEEHIIIFMLVLNFTRQQIADYLGIHISKLTRLLTKIADKLAVKSNSQDHTILAIVARGLHRHVPASYTSTIKQLSTHYPIDSGIYRIKV